MENKFDYLRKTTYLTINHQIILILFLLFPIVGIGQHKIKGQIVDSAHHSIQGVNIILLSTKNDSIKDGTITNKEGKFEFVNLEKGNYKIEFSYLGFASQQKTIKLKKDTVLKNVILEEDSNQLDEVIISTQGKKPLMEMKTDRTIFNVSQSDATIGGNSIDALKITPGLKVRNSKIEMAGKGAVKLMVDDKEIRLKEKSAFEYLKSIPSEQIERIELITNPPSKYTSEGSYGIINIKLKKNAKDQFFGTVTGSLSQAQKFSNNGNINLFYHQKRWQINAGANYLDSRHRITTKQDVNYPNYDLNEDNKTNRKWQGFGTFLELKFDLSENTSIGSNIKYSRTPDFDNQSEIESRYFNNSHIDSILQTQSQEKQKFDNQNYSFYIDHKIDTAGSKLSGEFSYTHYNKNQQEKSITKHTNSNEGFNLNSDNKHRIELFYIALDAELKRDFANYDFGLQASTSKTNNQSAYKNPDLENQDSNFNYDENIFSAYISASKDFTKQWSIKLGLRAEYTKSKGNSHSENQLTKSDYLEFFPTAYLNYELNDSNIFTFSYGRRIDRPSYGYLDPFRYYESRYNYQEGNPYLRPSYNNNFELKHLYKNKLSTSLYFSYITNQYNRINIVSENSPTIATVFDNYLKTYKFGLNENFYWRPFSWWESDNSGQIYYAKSKSKNPNTRPELSGFGAYLSTNNSLNLNSDKTFRAHFNFSFYFPEVNGIEKEKVYYYLDMGITALLFSEKLTLSLNAEDIFKTAINKTRTQINGIPQHFRAYYDSRLVRLSATYKFGNSKNKSERKVNDENKDRI